MFQHHHRHSPGPHRLSPELEQEIARANPKRLRQWTAQLHSRGEVVVPTRSVRTVISALISWVFVACLVLMFSVVPPSAWNPLSPDFAGWMPFFLGLVLAAGLVLFGFGAVLWTFVIPLIRPRLIVSRWGVRRVGSRLGWQFTLFAAAWPDIIRVDGDHVWMKPPLRPKLHVKIVAAGPSVHKSALPRRGTRGPVVVDYPVDVLEPRRARDVLAFLVQVHAAVLTGRFGRR